ncbi:MAG: bifunctional adenosylcobinamide kinase/adenosylcobinamide-phosphate guanylyltransferase [Bacteroidales bacterium]|nr:bifunctional adenosylcobinamide kinase/adenosylcobinamide-phosphate guanylyltransferase [Bacteroidales bacterium]
MKRILLVTGGQRSGKSTYAEKIVLEMAAGSSVHGDGRAVYMATSRIWDEEFAHRVKLHQERRGPQWINIEEPKYLSRHDVAGRVVLIDCVTLWSTNFFFDLSTEVQDESVKATMNAGEAQESANLVERTLQQIKEEFDRFTSQDAIFVFVTNEIGLCGVPENKVQRQFTDLLGWLNQYIASRADEVVFMVSGVPMKIK